jgi:hypothetical protein
MSSSSTASFASSQLLPLFSNPCSCHKLTTDDQTTYFRDCSNTLDNYFEKNNLKKSVIGLVGVKKYNDTIKYFKRCFADREERDKLIFVFCVLVLDITKDKLNTTAIKEMYKMFMLYKQKDFTFSYDNDKQVNSIFFSRLYDYLTFQLKNLKSYITKPLPVIEDIPVIDNEKECVACLDSGLVFVKKENFLCSCSPSICLECAKKLVGGRCVYCRKMHQFRDLINNALNLFYYKHKGKTLSVELPTKTYSKVLNLVVKDDDKINIGEFETYTLEDVEEYLKDDCYAIVLDWVFDFKSDDEIIDYLHPAIKNNFLISHLKYIMNSMRNNNRGALSSLIDPSDVDNTDWGYETLNEILHEYTDNHDLEETIRELIRGGDDESVCRKIGEDEYIFVPEFVNLPPINESRYNSFSIDTERYFLEECNDRFRTECLEKMNPVERLPHLPHQLLFEITDILFENLKECLVEYKEFIENYLEHIRFVTYNKNNKTIIFRTEISYTSKVILSIDNSATTFTRSKNIPTPSLKEYETIDTLTDDFSNKFKKLFQGYYTTNHSNLYKFLRREELPLVENIEHVVPSAELTNEIIEG